MIKTIDTDAIKQAINLIELAGNYTELRRESTQEYSGPCPWCGGNDRFHVRADGWFCRTCKPIDPVHGWHDVFDFVMLADNCDFRQAYEKLSGTIPTPAPEHRVKPVHRSVSTAGYFNEAKERAALLSSHDGLLTGANADARAVMAYLVGRGLQPATVAAFKLGYGWVYPPRAYDRETKKESYPKQLAVALPWFDRDGKLLAVKYRFLQGHTYTDAEGRERTENKTSRGPQAGSMFGWQAWRGPEQSATLFIVEGELNVLSIWQETHGAVDVLSAGSEGTTQHLPADVVELTKQYQRRIVWADKGEIADTAAAAIGADSVPSFKTEQHPKGLDANDLLRSGKLGGLLQRFGIEQQRMMVPTVGGRPPLPADQWVTGIATLPEARQIQRTLSGQWVTACGRGVDGFYVACPSSGLTIPAQVQA